MPPFDKVAVVSRLPVSKHLNTCKEIIDLLIEKYNQDVYLNVDFGERLNYSKVVKMEQLKNFDLIIALGGDGTILWTARYAQKVPLFGINAGHLGFLTTTTLENAFEDIDRLFKGNFVKEHCMRLKATIDGKELSTALNEVYVTNRLSAHICHLNLAVNDFKLGEHLLDGIIVSTPVGSTAYSLSAGGSIIEYSFNAMQIVPVNSVSRRIRPFVIPGDFIVSISLPESLEKEIVVINDGIFEAKLEEDAILEITQANTETVFVRFPDYGFFNRLQDKLDF